VEYDRRRTERKGNKNDRGTIQVLRHNNRGEKIMEKENIIKKLSEKISEEAIQRTKKDETKKGYDTDGYGYQYIVDRFNETCGSEWGFEWKIIKEIEGEYRSGAKFFEIVVDVGIWVTNKACLRSCAGGHISMSYADALKGAITNGFKKTAAFWGVGRDAYAGTIDDDNQPLPDSLENVKNKKETTKTPVINPDWQKMYDKTYDLLDKMTITMTETEKGIAYKDTCNVVLGSGKLKKLKFFTMDELKKMYDHLSLGLVK
jgi:hypothetical protein